MARASAWALAGFSVWASSFLIGFIPGTWMHPVPVPVRLGAFFLASASCYAMMFRGRSLPVKLGGVFVLAPVLSVGTAVGLYLALNLVMIALN